MENRRPTGAMKSFTEILRGIDNRFAGRAAPNDCGRV